VQPGSTLGRYEIIAPLAGDPRDDMFRARDVTRGREVAIRILPWICAYFEKRLARFEREARAVATLAHPSILGVDDFGKDGDITYAVMPLPDGPTLRDAMRGGAFSRRKAVEYARQIAEGLAAAHACGVYHLALAPEKIFVLSNGHLAIADFGLAVYRGRQSGSGDVEDLPDYYFGSMEIPRHGSPEQLTGSIGTDQRTDIFSVGCILHEMLSGTPAFAGESEIDVMLDTVRNEPRDLSTFADVPALLAQLVTRCLQKDPAERYQSARALARALAALE
jgi:serine/threonine-protein kinase